MRLVSLSNRITLFGHAKQQKLLGLSLETILTYVSSGEANEKMSNTVTHITYPGADPGFCTRGAGPTMASASL